MKFGVLMAHITSANMQEAGLLSYPAVSQRRDTCRFWAFINKVTQLKLDFLFKLPELNHPWNTDRPWTSNGLLLLFSSQNPSVRIETSDSFTKAALFRSSMYTIRRPSALKKKYVTATPRIKCCAKDSKQATGSNQERESHFSRVSSCKIYHLTLFCPVLPSIF